MVILVLLYRCEAVSQLIVQLHVCTMYYWVMHQVAEDLLFAGLCQDYHLSMLVDFESIRVLKLLCSQQPCCSTCWLAASACQ